MAKNRLLFSTPAEGVVLRPGTSEWLTRNRHHHHHDDHHHHNRRRRHRRHHHHHGHGIDVRDYEVIRVAATNRGTSVSCVYIAFLISGHDGGHSVFKLAKVKLAPGQSFSQSYAVPGRWLDILAYATRRKRRSCHRGGVDTIDVVVYGHR